MPDLKTLQAEIEKLQNRILELEKVKADLTAQNGTPFKFGVNSSSEYGYMLNGVLVPFGSLLGNATFGDSIRGTCSAYQYTVRTVNVTQKLIDQGNFFVFCIASAGATNSSIQIAGADIHPSDPAIKTNVMNEVNLSLKGPTSSNISGINIECTTAMKVVFFTTPKGYNKPFDVIFGAAGATAYRLIVIKVRK